MRQVILSMKDYIFADAVASTLRKDPKSDFAVQTTRSPEEIVQYCRITTPYALLLETDFSSEIEEPKDVSSRCDIAIEVRRKLPNCRVYLICEDGYPEKLPALNKAVELKLIDGYCIGDLAAEQMRTWLSETAETISGRSAR